MLSENVLVDVWEAFGLEFIDGSALSPPSVYAAVYCCWYFHKIKQEKKKTEKKMNYHGQQKGHRAFAR